MMANISHQILDVDRKQEAAYEREYGILLEIYRVERDMMRRISGRRDKQGTDIDIDGSILDLSNHELVLQFAASFPSRAATLRLTLRGLCLFS